MTKEKNLKRGTFGRKVKGVLAAIVVSIIGIIVLLNGDKAQTFKDSVYSELEVKYAAEEPENKVSAQTAEAGSEEQVEEVKEEVKEVSEPKNDNKVVKRYHLTVNTDLTIPSNVSGEEIDQMLEGTALHGLGATFAQAEQESGVNALYLMGLAALESGWGTSKYAVQRNNLYGYQAYDSDPDQAAHFSGWKESTLFIARFLKKSYLTPGGSYYYGKSARSIDVKYCSDKTHADKIVDIVNERARKIGK